MEVRLSCALFVEVAAHHIFGILLVGRMASRSQDSTKEGRNHCLGGISPSTRLWAHAQERLKLTFGTRVMTIYDNRHIDLPSGWGRDAGGVNIEERCWWLLICWHSAGKWVWHDWASWPGCYPWSILELRSISKRFIAQIDNRMRSQEGKPQGWGASLQYLRYPVGLGFEYSDLRLTSCLLLN